MSIMDISYNARMGMAKNTCEIMSGGVKKAATIKAMMMANLRLDARKSAVIRPARPNNVKNTGS